MYLSEVYTEHGSDLFYSKKKKKNTGSLFRGKEGGFRDRNNVLDMDITNKLHIPQRVIFVMTSIFV